MAVAICPVMSAHAQQAGIPFSGEVATPDTCVIVVNRDGTLAASPDLMVLSSTEAGGQSGSARIFSFRSYEISVDAPSAFSSAPADGNTGVSFQTLFSGTDVYRGRDFAERDGSSPVRLRGNYSVTDLNVNMIAIRSGSLFPPGDYTAQATVRCE